MNGAKFKREKPTKIKKQRIKQDLKDWINKGTTAMEFINRTLYNENNRKTINKHFKDLTTGERKKITIKDLEKLNENFRFYKFGLNDKRGNIRKTATAAEMCNGIEFFKNLYFKKFLPISRNLSEWNAKECEKITTKKENFNTKEREAPEMIKTPNWVVRSVENAEFSDSIKAELEQLKKTDAQTIETLNTLAETITAIAAEMESIKTKVNAIFSNNRAALIKLLTEAITNVSTIEDEEAPQIITETTTTETTTTETTTTETA